MSVNYLPKSLQIILLLVVLGWYMASDTIGTIVQYGCMLYATLIGLCYIIPPYRSHCIDLLPSSSGYVLITGCTNGLGLEMSHRFARRGWNLLLIGRSEKALKELVDELNHKYVTVENAIKIEYIVQDLAQLDASEKVLEQVKAKGFDDLNKYVDILINNAGFASVGEFVDSKLDDQLSMIHLHISTIVSLSHLFLPGMIHRRRGRLVTISSMVSYLPAPRASIYAATKAFLTSWMKSLEYEIGLEIDKITRRRREQDDAIESEMSGNSRSSSLFSSSSPNLTTVLVTPGATRTNFSTTAECETSLIFRLPLLSMETKVATTEIVEGIISGRKEIQLGVLNRLTIFLLPKLPSKLSNCICYVLWGRGDVAKDFFDQFNHNRPSQLLKTYKQKKAE